MNLKNYAKAAVLACASFTALVASFAVKKFLPLGTVTLWVIAVILILLAWNEAKAVRTQQRAKKAPFTTVEDGKGRD